MPKHAADAEAAAEAKATADAKAAAQAEAAQETVAKQNAGTEAGAAGVGFPANSAPAPQLSPDGEAGTPEPTPDGATVGVNGDAAPTDPSAGEATPTVAPRRPRRPPGAPDDWKKGISIFGGG